VLFRSVYRRKLVSICPQRFWEVRNQFTVTLDELAALQKNFVDMYDHDNYCIDVCKTPSSNIFKIIETNEWYNSGPGLFQYNELTNVPTNTILFKQRVDQRPKIKTH
jgi:hypothetical protein